MGVAFTSGQWVPSVYCLHMNFSLTFLLWISTSAARISSVLLLNLVWCTRIKDREICMLKLIWKLHC